MADFVYNIAKGKVAEYAARVNANDPTNSALIVVAIVTSTGDAVLKDLDTLSAVTGDAGTAEATNSGYGRKTLTDTDSITVTTDDSGDKVDVDFPDQTWTAVAAGDNWTDLVVCYDNDTGAGTDANIVPLTQHDFAVTPDGSDITAQLATAGFFSAS